LVGKNVETLGAVIWLYESTIVWKYLVDKVIWLIN